MYVIEDLKFKHILNIKNISIRDNGVTYIIGSSGSGKSTLLSFLKGVKHNHSGKIIYCGKNIYDYDNNILNREIGYLSQHNVFFKGTIKDEFDYICHLLKINVQDYNKFLNLVCLDYELDTNIDILSGGEKQRLCIARILMTNKNVLLLDEPTSSLDKLNEKVIIKNIIEYANENDIKLIIVTHNTELINEKDEVITIENGGVANGN